MTTATRALADTYVTMLNSHDPHLVDQFVAENYINHNPFVADGREGNRQFWTAFFAALPDLSATMEDLVISGDRVVGRFVYRGTHTGELMGIPASGKAVEMRSIDIWRVADGMFAEHWDELNLMEVFQQIGALPPLGAGPEAQTGITDLVRAFYEPFRTGDTAIYGEILADDWVDIPLAPGQERGSAGMAGQIEAFRRALPDYDVKNEDLIVGDDRVAVRNTVSGTHQGAFMGYEPTGRRIEMRTMDIHQVRGDRIVTTWHLEDIAGLIAQLSAPDGAAIQRGGWA